MEKYERRETEREKLTLTEVESTAMKKKKRTNSEGKKIN